MLDVIGAGATATAKEDWNQIWRKSKEAEENERQVNSIHSDGLSRPPIETSRHSEFAASWRHQTAELIKRSALRNWRDPTYLLAKLLLNVFAGCVKLF